MIRICKKEDIQALSRMGHIPGTEFAGNLNAVLMAAVNARFDQLLEDVEDTDIGHWDYRLLVIQDVNEIRLEGLVQDGNVDDDVFSLARSFVYFPNEAGSILGYASFIHFYRNEGVDGIDDRTTEYIVEERIILGTPEHDAILPHAEDEYNEEWEKEYHSARLIQQNRK